MRQLSNREIQAVSGGAATDAASTPAKNSPILSLIALPFTALILTAFIKADGGTTSYFEVLRQGFDSIFQKT